MGDPRDGRGILYPARLPTFQRVPAAPELAGLVRWFWIPQWDLAPGRTSRQQVLPFPASNLVVQPEGVTLAGPTTGISARDLRGTGWAVGALLRPAALAAMHAEPQEVRDREIPVDAPDLHAAVVGAMPDVGAAVHAFTDWVSARLPAPDAAAETANAFEDLIADDPEILRVEQVAARLGVSVRGVQRLARRYVGLPPLAVIRRYRLQAAAERLRTDPDTTIAQVAADLGYADHAHLTGDFRTVLGLTPNSYRRG
ncbi:helix-turn-helix domain-containing protein [Pseudonocardia sp. WMMC193]|uniref:helix-turn-helix domain-containing protein n=1 Tax=Pseudonocardia sp. WMMC193 TaxID=2911965 RepID=UPI001F2B6DBE|nr:helix-turn-helix domain-containing protein [Pseudonocardia sp. WMMC193]MCF7552087.1 helix-turn-helix domain-containing protein [Pseudonocardia sp. WMMC193]